MFVGSGYTDHVIEDSVNTLLAWCSKVLRDFLPNVLDGAYVYRGYANVRAYFLLPLIRSEV